ncbi:hypothetical protein LINPERHAP1_LOCUS34278, partial [Linum perenne]
QLQSFFFFLISPAEEERLHPPIIKIPASSEAPPETVDVRFELQFVLMEEKGLFVCLFSFVDFGSENCIQQPSNLAAVTVETRFDSMISTRRMGNGTLVIHTPMKKQHHFDQNGESDTDVMTRRLKNRERQRRYRARKRLEADIGKGSASSVIQSDHGHHHYEPRVYCTRKWKKEARRRGADSAASVGVQCTAAIMISSGLASNSNDVHPNPLPSLGRRRNWKAEARNKNKKSPT